VVIANAPDTIRGYEEIKLHRIAETRELVAQHLSRFAAASPLITLTTSRVSSR